MQRVFISRKLNVPSAPAASHCADIVVSHLAHDTGDLFSHCGDLFPCDGRRRRLFDHFLVAPLVEPVALEPGARRCHADRQHLELDVARALDQPLEIDLGVAEAALGQERERSTAASSSASSFAGACRSRRRRLRLTSTGNTNRPRRGEGSRPCRRVARRSPSTSGMP